MINDNKYILSKLVLFSITKNFQKVKRVFDFGHFFCPFLKIPKRFWEKVVKIRL